MSTASMAATVSTLLFDADGVLQSMAPGWECELTGFLGSRAATQGPEFLYEIFVAERPTMTGATDFAVALQQVLERFDVPDRVDDVLAASVRIVPDVPVIQAVRDLRAAGYRCCLASNQQNRRAAFMRAHLGYERVFDEQFYSCELGLAKPDPAYFTAIATALDTNPGAILFIDDNPDNVAGAGAAGLRGDLFPKNAGRPALDAILRRHRILEA